MAQDRWCNRRFRKSLYLISSLLNWSAKDLIERSFGLISLSISLQLAIEKLTAATEFWISISLFSFASKRDRCITQPVNNFLFAWYLRHLLLLLYRLIHVTSGFLFLLSSSLVNRLPWPGFVNLFRPLDMLLYAVTATNEWLRNMLNMMNQKEAWYTMTIPYFTKEQSLTFIVNS